ncbi:GGDEF domain-containing protein [Alteromonas oceanisediminis]|uniref:GGDEF domain-containing protein n=1 Tax=Alteromonas oceanisediminis TaxID=2836180 RepID=UPI001BDB6C68|nr:GGDEF domain-containing protein [Alteromonas oceanisediminis]MBT0585865.1 GGDEF domain-containing protein [Alteromonas oceanisediminis]
MHRKDQHALINGLIGTFLMVVFKRKPNHKCFLYWALSCGVFVLGGVTSSLRAYSVSPLISYFLADVFLIAAPALVLMGLLRFSRLTCTPIVKHLCLGCSVILLSVLYGVHTDATVNPLVTGLAAGSVFFAGVMMLQRSIIIEPVFTRLLQLIFAAHGLILWSQGVIIANSAAADYTNITTLSLLLSRIVLTTLTALLLPWLSFLQLERKLTIKSQRDGLTQVANRDHFFYQAQSLWQHQDNHPCVLMMIDIDHFKNINDQYGHAMGDVAIRETARGLSKQLRNSDLIGRVGGEEFAVLLPRTDCATGHKVAERLLSYIRSLDIHVGDRTVSLTISVGMISAGSTEITFETAYKAADSTLYQSKGSGRNRISDCKIHGSERIYQPVVCRDNLPLPS